MSIQDYTNVFELSICQMLNHMDIFFFFHFFGVRFIVVFSSEYIWPPYTCRATTKIFLEQLRNAPSLQHSLVCFYKLHVLVVAYIPQHCLKVASSSGLIHWFEDLIYVVFNKLSHLGGIKELNVLNVNVNVCILVSLHEASEFLSCSRWYESYSSTLRNRYWSPYQ